MINISRDESVPISLSIKKSHRNPDVIEALYRNFKGKCYLTELVFEYPDEMEIDHFIPQSIRPDLALTWKNLYPIHEKTNKSKGKQNPIEGYLDPCNPDDDVEKEIIYKVEFGGNALFKATNPVNKKAQNTAELLNRVHKQLKPTIKDKHHAVVNAIARWNTAKKAGDIEKEYEEELALKTLLSRESYFTMLMRSIWSVANDDELVQLFD